MLHLGTADPVTRHHTDHQWSLEDELKLSETRPRACKRCSLACMQSEQAEGGRVQSMSNQIGCGHQAQQGPRRRRCLSGKSHLCPSSSQYPLVLQRLHPRQNVAFAEHDDTFLRVCWTLKIWQVILSLAKMHAITDWKTLQKTVASGKIVTQGYLVILLTAVCVRVEGAIVLDKL